MPFAPPPPILYPTGRVPSPCIIEPITRASWQIVTLDGLPGERGSPFEGLPGMCEEVCSDEARRRCLLAKQSTANTVKHGRRTQVCRSSSLFLLLCVLQAPAPSATLLSCLGVSLLSPRGIDRQLSHRQGPHGPDV